MKSVKKSHTKPNQNQSKSNKIDHTVYLNNFFERNVMNVGPPPSSIYFVRN